MSKSPLSIATFPTGFSYADRSRERDGDYVRLAFLPFDTLKLEWIAKRFSPELRAEILAHANSIAARDGQDYPVSTSGQTVKLGTKRSHQSKSPAQLERDIAETVAPKCNTCGRAAASPYRRSAGGKIVEGCIDDAHTGHLYGASLDWHMRPSAKSYRTAMKAKRRELLRSSPRSKRSHSAKPESIATSDRKWLSTWARKVAGRPLANRELAIDADRTFDVLAQERPQVGPLRRQFVNAVMNLVAQR